MSRGVEEAVDGRVEGRFGGGGACGPDGPNIGDVIGDGVCGRHVAFNDCMGLGRLEVLVVVPGNLARLCRVQIADKVGRWSKIIPQRLKPSRYCSACGADESVPFQNCEFFINLTRLCRVVDFTILFGMDFLLGIKPRPTRRRTFHEGVKATQIRPLSGG